MKENIQLPSSSLEIQTDTMKYNFSSMKLVNIILKGNSIMRNVFLTLYISSTTIQGNSWKLSYRIINMLLYKALAGVSQWIDCWPADQKSSWFDS